MKLSSQIKPISYLKSHASEIVRNLKELGETMIITQNGEAKAVIQDPKSYEDMKNAISILKLLSFAEEDIKNGNLHDEEDVFSSVEELLKK